MKKIAYETNLFCIQQIQAGKYSGAPINTDSHEIETLIGMFLRMGITHLPSVSMYWATETNIPQISTALGGGRRRYEFLYIFLHFNDNEKQKDSTDKLYKIAPILKWVSDACESIEPEEYNSVDEQVCKIDLYFT